MSAPLQDRVVVIIGGTSGMGLSATQACLRAGARIVAVGLGGIASPEEELRAERLRVLAGDARSPETAAEAIAAALEDFGRFDALYHVAGGSGRSAGDGPLHEVTDAGIDYTLELNLHSVIHSNRAAVCSFLERGVPGTILNMGSILAESPSPKHFATHVYTAAKSAIVGLSRACASYYAPSNIRFNVIAPGLTDTPMATRALCNEDIMEFVQRRQPLDGGRAGQPHDLDAAVVFFLSDQSRFVTGQVLAVDGGWSVSDGCGTLAAWVPEGQE